MKKLLAPLLTLFLFSSVYAEVLTSSNDIHEVPFEQITFKNTIAYANGKPYTGRVVEYKEGKKYLEYNYKKGIQEGLEIGWNQNGIKRYESNWKGGKREGLYIAYWPNGKNRSNVNYINDVKEGLKIVWYKNGQINYQQNYSGGTRLGSKITVASNKGDNYIKGIKRLKDPWSKNAKDTLDVNAAEQVVKINKSNTKGEIELETSLAPVLKFKRLNKKQIFNKFNGKIIIFNDWKDKRLGNYQKSICIEFKGGEAKALPFGKYKNGDTKLTCNAMEISSVWVEYMGGKLCFEKNVPYQRQEICRNIRISGKVIKIGVMPSNIVNRSELHGINIKKEETKNYERDNYINERDNYIKGIKRLKDPWSKDTNTKGEETSRAPVHSLTEGNDNEWREKFKKWLKNVMPRRLFPLE